MKYCFKSSTKTPVDLLIKLFKILKMYNKLEFLQNHEIMGTSIFSGASFGVCPLFYSIQSLIIAWAVEDVA